MEDSTTQGIASGQSQGEAFTCPGCLQYICFLKDKNKLPLVAIDEVGRGQIQVWDPDGHFHYLSARPPPYRFHWLSGSGFVLLTLRKCSVLTHPGSLFPIKYLLTTHSELSHVGLIGQRQTSPKVSPALILWDVSWVRAIHLMCDLGEVTP